MNVWGVELGALSAAERDYLGGILRRYPEPVTLEQMWRLMDEAWDRCNASVDRLDAPEARAFYRHPVWLLNGVFTDVHAESRAHREALAEWIVARRPRRVIDFGGGYGALARRVAAQLPEAEILIVDPFPSAAAVAACRSHARIRYVPELDETCDVLVAQDVLEHVADPVALAARLVGSVKPGGFLIFANCFEPCIKCHVPATFHLAATFKSLMRLLGCASLGPVPRCEHALAFRRTRAPLPPRWALALFSHYSRLRARRIRR